MQKKIVIIRFTCISDSGTGATGKLIEQESAVDLDLNDGDKSSVDIKSDGELSAVKLESAVVFESASGGIKCKETFSLPKKIRYFLSIFEKIEPLLSNIINIFNNFGSIIKERKNEIKFNFRKI